MSLSQFNSSSWVQTDARKSIMKSCAGSSKPSKFHIIKNTLMHCLIFIEQAYVLGKSDHPLILYGDSGCGKTSLMAKAASQVSDN